MVVVRTEPLIRWWSSVTAGPNATLASSAMCDFVLVGVDALLPVVNQPKIFRLIPIRLDGHCNAVVFGAILGLVDIILAITRLVVGLLK